jgi:putative endonuclease
MWFVYIIYNKRVDKYYIGSTNNIERRLSEHNRSTYKNKSRFTSKYEGQWTLCKRIEVESQAAARAIEKKIKSLKSRKIIESIISGSQTALVAQWIEQSRSSG